MPGRRTFEHHRRAVGQPRPVHLGQGLPPAAPSSRRTPPGCLAQVLDELPAQLGEGQRRRGVLQLAELGDPFGRKEVALVADLPQLDEGRPQLFEHLAHSGRRLEWPGLGLRQCRALPACPVRPPS